MDIGKGQVYAMKDGKKIVEKDRDFHFQDVNLANRMSFFVSKPGNEALVKHEQGRKKANLLDRSDE